MKNVILDEIIIIRMGDFDIQCALMASEANVLF